jgi:hypothetical protein
MAIFFSGTSDWRPRHRDNLRCDPLRFQSIGRIADVPMTIVDGKPFRKWHFRLLAFLKESSAT